MWGLFLTPIDIKLSCYTNLHCIFKTQLIYNASNVNILLHLNHTCITECVLKYWIFPKKYTSGIHKFHCKPTAKSWLKIGAKNFGGKVHDEGRSEIFEIFENSKKTRLLNNEKITNFKFHCNHTVEVIKIREVEFYYFLENSQRQLWRSMRRRHIII